MISDYFDEIVRRLCCLANSSIDEAELCSVKNEDAKKITRFIFNKKKLNST